MLDSDSVLAMDIILHTIPIIILTIILTGHTGLAGAVITGIIPVTVIIPAIMMVVIPGIITLTTVMVIHIMVTEQEIAILRE